MKCGHVGDISLRPENVSMKKKVFVKSWPQFNIVHMI